MNGFEVLCTTYLLKLDQDLDLFLFCQVLYALRLFVP